MGDVVDFDGPTLLDIPPEKVLQGAMKTDLATVIVIGETRDGALYAASSSADLADMILAVELFKAELMKQALSER